MKYGLNSPIFIVTPEQTTPARLTADKHRVHAHSTVHTFQESFTPILAKPMPTPVPAKDHAQRSFLSIRQHTDAKTPQMKSDLSVKMKQQPDLDQLPKVAVPTSRLLAQNIFDQPYRMNKQQIAGFLE